MCRTTYEREKALNDLSPRRKRTVAATIQQPCFHKILDRCYGLISSGSDDLVVCYGVALERLRFGSDVTIRTQAAFCTHSRPFTVIHHSSSYGVVDRFLLRGVLLTYLCRTT